MEKRVFISMGSTATSEQREFVDAILNMIKLIGLHPVIMNENEWSFEQPLKAIKKIVRDCDGLVIIAFTRTKIETGYEVKKSGNVDLKQISLPTPWNHIEGSIAYSYDLPILVIAENGLKEEGLIEKGYDWTVLWSDLNSQSVMSDKFKGFLTSWKVVLDGKDKPNSFNADSKIDPEKIQIGEIFKSLTVPQIWKMLAAIITLLTAIATISYKIGGGKWPWEK